MPEPNLKPCPNRNCQSNSTWIKERLFGYSGSCMTCNMKGPVREKKEEAAQSWNEAFLREEDDDE